MCRAREDRTIESTPSTSERGAATRGALLRAAYETFIENGFAQAGVTDVVVRAGASVGSLYHHFSGKADLYLTLFEEFSKRQVDRAKTAVQAARRMGEIDPMRLFLAGAQAYLDGCLVERSLAALFLAGDGPPGFDLLLRKRIRDWARRSAALFAEAEEPVDEALIVVLTGAMAAAVAEVSLSPNEQASRQLAKDVLAIIATIQNPKAQRG